MPAHTPDPTDDDRRLLVIVPTYDEADTIDELLQRTVRAVPWAHVLVVDDASPDGTADMVEAFRSAHPNVQVMRRDAKSGLGEAYRAGYRWALQNEYGHVAQMDGDLSHQPEQIPEMWAAVDDADAVIGSRYVPGGRTTDWSRRRRLLSKSANRYVGVAMGLRINDATSGFRIYATSALRRLGVDSIESNGYCFQVEMTAKLLDTGVSFVEVPITFSERAGGTSKMSSAIIIEAWSRVTGWSLARLLRFDLARPRREHRANGLVVIGGPV